MEIRIDERVRVLAQARSEEARFAQMVANLEAELTRSPLGQTLAVAKDFLSAARLHMNDAEVVVREAAIGVYLDDGTKKPHTAVEVVLSTVLDYEEGVALDYCREHLPHALKLDKRTFEKAAPVLGLGFVAIRQEPTTRIKRDLSAWVEDEDNSPF